MTNEFAHITSERLSNEVKKYNRLRKDRRNTLRRVKRLTEKLASQAAEYKEHIEYCKTVFETIEQLRTSNESK